MKTLWTLGLIVGIGVGLAGCRANTATEAGEQPKAEEKAPEKETAAASTATPTPAPIAEEASKPKARSAPVVRKLDFSAKWPARYKGEVLLVVRTAKKAPRIDGDLSDDVWQNSKRLEFKYLNGRDGKLKYKTVGYIAADKENLYLAWSCFDSDVPGLIADIEDHDGNVWDDDDVEAFLLPSHDDLEPYYQLILNSEKTQFDSFDKDADSWNPKGVVKDLKKYKDRWDIEVRIPLKQLGVKPGKTSRLWRINLTRSRPARGDDDVQEAAWSPTEDESNHVPEKFGYVLFESIEGPSPSGLNPESK